MLSIAALAPSSLLVGAPGARTTARVSSSPMMANILDTLKSTQGPEVFWGPEGPLQDTMKEESDLKEYDTFSKFIDACAATGVDLTQPGIKVCLL